MTFVTQDLPETAQQFFSCVLGALVVIAAVSCFYIKVNYLYLQGSLGTDCDINPKHNQGSPRSFIDKPLYGLTHKSSLDPYFSISNQSPNKKSEGLGKGFFQCRIFHQIKTRVNLNQTITPIRQISLNMIFWFNKTPITHTKRPSLFLRMVAMEIR